MVSSWYLQPGEVTRETKETTTSREIKRLVLESYSNLQWVRVRAGNEWKTVRGKPMRPWKAYFTMCCVKGPGISGSVAEVPASVT